MLVFDDGAAPPGAPTVAGVLLGMDVESLTVFVVLLVALLAFSLPQPVQKVAIPSKTRAAINLRMGVSPEMLDDWLERR